MGKSEKVREREREKKKLRELIPRHPEYARKILGALDNDFKIAQMTESEKREAVDDLKKFHGLPPYDEVNPCRSDGIFANSLKEKYGMDIAELERATGFKDLKAKWNHLRTEFGARTS